MCSSLSSFLGAVFVFLTTSVGVCTNAFPFHRGCLSLLLSPGRGSNLVVTHVFHHQSASKYRDLQTPAHCHIVIVLAGAIVASLHSTIGIDGHSMFTNNSAGGHGGETGHGTCIALKVVLRTTTVVLVCRRALFLSSHTWKTKHKTECPFPRLAYICHMCPQWYSFKSIRQNT